MHMAMTTWRLGFTPFSTPRFRIDNAVRQLMVYQVQYVTTFDLTWLQELRASTKVDAKPIP